MTDAHESTMRVYDLSIRRELNCAQNCRDMAAHLIDLAAEHEAKADGYLEARNAYLGLRGLENVIPFRQAEEGGNLTA